jgi:uncharacterized membrane protein (UPF0182 family)
MWISLAAVVILLVNIRRRGWALPVLAVGLWAFVAIVVGAIYPAVYQALKVNPAQNKLEQPYIARNIAATRSAMGLTDVRTKPFGASQSLTNADVQKDAPTLESVRLWDPSITAQTYARQQTTRSYYSFNTLAVDRYTVNGQLAPAVVGVRQVNDNDLPAQGWVNEHLQYTHGYGMIVSPANQATSNGEPVFAIQNVPPVSSAGLPTIKQPAVYFGLSTPGGGDSNYVVANTKQDEIDYQRPNQSNKESHYGGDGGIPMTGLNRLAFAVRFGDLNLLISDQITPKSRLMFVRDITQRVEKAAPFLSLDSDPYPVLVNGRIDWVQDAYTTTDHYPYSQDADQTILPLSSGLQQNFNYVRNSVKVVTDAYTGKMTFYVMDPRDPIIRTWERIFPSMFTPASKMPADLRDHLRYPEDMFMVQAQMYGRYHITNPQAFYSAGDAWTLSQDPGSGSPNAQAQETFTTTAQGQLVSTGQTQRMAPLYQVLQVPGQQQLTYNITDAYVPVSKSNQLQTLSGFMVGGSDPGQYGKLSVYVTKPGQDLDGPALVEGRIQENAAVSRQISLLDQGGSSVQLGNVLMVPVGQSMLYFRPLYVQASRNAVPELQDVIVVFSGSGGGANNTQVAMAPTLQGALKQIFTSLNLPGAGRQGSTGQQPAPSSGPANARVQSLANQVSQLYAKARADLKAGNFSAYGNDISQLGNAIQQLQQATGSGSTTTTTVPKGPGVTRSAPAASASSTTTTVPVAPTGGNSTPAGVALGAERRQRTSAA